MLTSTMQHRPAALLIILMLVGSDVYRVDCMRTVTDEESFTDVTTYADSEEDRPWCMNPWMGTKHYHFESSLPDGTGMKHMALEFVRDPERPVLKVLKGRVWQIKLVEDLNSWTGAKKLEWQLAKIDEETEESTIDLLEATSITVEDSAKVLRQAVGFNGRWIPLDKKTVVIEGEKLVWADGTRSKIEVTGNTCARHDDGHDKPVLGSLATDGTIKWDNEEMWHRDQMPQLLTVTMQNGNKFEIMGGRYYDETVLLRSAEKLAKEGSSRQLAQHVREDPGSVGAVAHQYGTGIGTGAALGTAYGAGGGFAGGLVFASYVSMASGVAADVFVGAIFIGVGSLGGAAAGAVAGVGVGAVAGVVIGGGSAIYQVYKMNKGTSYFASEKLFEKLWCLTQHFDRCGEDMLVRKGVMDCPS